MNTATPIGADVADAIFNILVKLAGASPDMREEFIYHHTLGRTEFRFQGSLGFGGKFRNTSYDGWYVDCYQEDLTPAREQVIEATNAALRQLRGTFDGEEG